jgi:SAM-dependent methyltransferase
MFPIRAAGDLEDLLRAAKGYAVVAAWQANGLFAALADGPRPLSELPGDPRALANTLPVLRHLGLLVGEGHRVGLSALGRELLEANDLPGARELETLDDLAKMGTVVAEGGPVRDDEGIEKVTDGGVVLDDPERFARFLDMLYGSSERSATVVFEWLRPHLSKQAAMLDVGGGHGRYARVFADHGHAATLFDFGPVIDYARDRHGEALGYVAGNFREADVEFGGPYDVVLLSNIVHGEPAAMNRSLLKRLASHLKPGGFIVMKDMFLGSRGRDPGNAVFFGLTMLYHTRAGASPDLDEARGWLEDAGLGEVRVTTLEGFELVRGRRVG